MALIKCTECGKEFSDKAPSCPNCGCPTREILPQAKNTAPVKELNTGLGKIIAYDDCVKLIPANFLSLGRSERILYYSGINGISYRPTSLLTQGYIQFVVAGTVAQNVNILEKNWERKMAKDENTIMIKYSHNKSFKKDCDDFVAFLNSKLK